MFCHAPLNHRIKRVMTIYQVNSESEARLMIERADNARRKYVRTMAGKEWSDVTNYHLSIDTSYSSFQETTDVIIHFLKTKGMSVYE